MYAPTAIKAPHHDRSMKNGGASALTTKRIVKFTADKTIDVATAATDYFAGILSQSSGTFVAGQDPGANAVGVMENVQVAGKGILTAGGPVTIGHPVTSDSTGRGIDAATLLAAGTPTTIIGRAATAASGAGVDFEIEIGIAAVYNGQASLVTADHTALKAISAANRYDGQIVKTANDNKTWRFIAAGTATDTTEQLICAPSSGTGVWACCDPVTELVLPFTYSTADAAALFTVPAGAEIQVLGFAWNVGTSLTGGSSSSIGASSSKTGYSTKGDFIGGSGGDVAATLVSTGNKYKAGTIGAGFDTNAKRDAAFLVAADTIRFDRIVSAFTAGAGNLIVRTQILANAGA